jgi:signal transduction histidine kinase
VDSSRTLSSHVDLFDALAGIVSEGVIRFDDNRRIVSCNAAAQRLLGYSGGRLAGAVINDLLHESNAGDPFADSSSVIFRDTVGSAIAVQTRSVDGIVVFSATRIDQIEQLKNELVSTVSHELKTPLAAIKAYTATLRENPDIYLSHREEFLRVVEEQADRLARVVDDMLLITRVDTDHLLRRRSRVRVMQLIDQALLGISYNPAVHPIVVQTGDADVSGDPERLRDVFRNLIENAIKYSPAGGRIVIRAHQTGNFTTIEVEDCGIGIAAEHLPYIFDRFYRVEPVDAPDAPGSGLGLYIVSAIVRAHGGTISVRSEEGAGTTFTLRFPQR